MKHMKPQSQSSGLCLPWYGCHLLFVLLASLAASGAYGQNTPAAPAAGQQAGQTATPAAATPAASQTSVAGAPVMGFLPPAVTATPAAQAATRQSAVQLPRIDPITGAPISSLGLRASTATEVTPGQESKPAGDSSVHQGLQVHGHWVINVRNPDGTLVQHHEFENSLEPSAQGFMVGLLSGYMIPGDWMIVLGAQSGNGACNLSFEYCGLVHNAATFPAQGYCNVYYCTGSTLNYTYNFGSGFQGPYSIVLSGTITANQTGTIGSVYTLLNMCANNAYAGGTNPNGIETSSPAACVTQTNPATWYGPFTDTNIAPIPVTSGQLIQAIVTITFS